jgi:hypothetical protein
VQGTGVPVSDHVVGVETPPNRASSLGDFINFPR